MQHLRVDHDPQRQLLQVHQLRHDQRVCVDEFIHGQPVTAARHHLTRLNEKSYEPAGRSNRCFLVDFNTDALAVKLRPSELLAEAKLLILVR